jgi:saccharopine dehydrogenase-like NADP-dependent oxidoreductase
MAIQPPKDIVIIGAGKIGATVAGLLASTNDYQITLVDRSPDVLGRIDPKERIHIAIADVEDSSKLVDVLNGQFAVINAAPFHLTTIIAEAARAARTHYLDLTEDVASMRRVRELAADASTAFIPQCGLAPGQCENPASFCLAKNGNPSERRTRSPEPPED